MTCRKINKGVYSVGAIDWNRTLFDALVPLPKGTSYNSYLVCGSEKTALIDTVEPSMAPELFRNLEALDVKKIDYVIANHAEQDHSGSIPEVLSRFPNAKLVTNAKCKEMLQNFFQIADDRIKVVADGETLSLGDRSLRFILAPWVHWPETMFTFSPEDKILFSCDFLGSHLATSDLFATNESLVLEEAKLYYAQIMMPFAVLIRKHLETVKKLEAEIIAPSHGPAYNRPALILDAYQRWTSDQVTNDVVLAYVSMHGSTEQLAMAFVDSLMQAGVSVRPFNMVSANLGELASASVEAATISLASPAVLGGAHPSIVYAAYLLNALKPKARYLALIGSYSWGSKLVEQLRELTKGLKAEALEPVFTKGQANKNDLEAIKALAKNIAEKHKALGLF